MKSTNWFMFLSCLIMLMIESPILIVFLSVGVLMGYHPAALSVVGILWYATTAILIGWWCGFVSRIVCGTAETQSIRQAVKVGDIVKDGNGAQYLVNGVLDGYITYEPLPRNLEVFNAKP